ncbi:AI-2E family transporter [Fusibacter tunisiensis]|uniref:PurR-regulated permease PerM n=1 Tax=Fusibacter tunisiensis TaxID=1008308 RepID=A0ABS2MMP9_9FIRM|nr:AI-2E family transporter [Fusibacter tunisiensis]MBM7560659.1 putative PurR-regulated permease PerM [Fusibacter tunisiensis]
MNLKEIKLAPFIKLIFIIAIIAYVVLNTDIMGFVSKGISPVLTAFIIAYILDYVVRFFELKMKVPRSLSILISILLFLLILTTIGLFIVPRVVGAVSSLIKAIGNFEFDINALSQLDFDNFYLNEIQQAIVDTVTPLIQKLTNATGTAVLIVVNEVQKITSGLISLVISFAISIYMLGEKRDLLARIKRTLFAYLSDQTANQVLYASRMANKIFKAFFLGKLLDSTIIGVLAYLVFTIFNFEYALLIALIIGLTNMIPYFGPFIGAVPAAVITLIANPSSPIDVVWILICILAIQQLDSLVIGPFILGDSVGVSAFWIIVAVTVGGATFGIVGMFMGVPVLVLLKTLIEEDVEKRLAFQGYEGFQSNDIKNKKSRK